MRTIRRQSPRERELARLAQIESNNRYAITSPISSIETGQTYQLRRNGNPYRIAHISNGTHALIINSLNGRENIIEINELIRQINNTI